MADETEKVELPAANLRKRRRFRRTLQRVFFDPGTPTSWSVARVVIVAFLVWNLAGFVSGILFALKNLFFVMILAIFFAYLIDPIVKTIRQPFKHKKLDRFMPRPAAIVLAYLIVFSILGFGIATLAPQASNQAREFGSNIPTYATEVQEKINDLSRWNRGLKFSKSIQEKITEKTDAIITGTGDRVTQFFGNFLLDFVTSLPWIVLIPILAFFFLKDVNFFRALFLRAFPVGRWRTRAELILEEVNHTLAAYTRAQLISCFLIGSVCALGFWLIGIKYALLLGILAGVLEFIPLIGPVTIGILAISVAGFSGSPWQAFSTFIFLIILRLTHDYVTYPRIVRGGILLHPLMIILSILAGEQIAGIPGVFLAIPIVALLTVIYRHVMEHTGSRGIFSGWLDPQETPAQEISSDR